ncbi:hypothetical protein SLS58_010579 [Diplodia intermedia]|uniref:Uncharacterized protein n=1 Tax=Diplodia intermedia TaxID=856260 RepID=A0ABR3T570_9PEZI
MTQIKMAPTQPTSGQAGRVRSTFKKHEQDDFATANRHEKSIKHTGDHAHVANELQILGIGSPGGFAKYVYELIRMKTDETRDSGDKYFIYHADNFWYPAFHGMVERSGGLPSSFCMMSNSLDHLCRHMASLRSEGHEDAPFHLLMPAWENVQLDGEALHFPKELQPLCIEGTTINGRPLVTMDVPRAPKGLFSGVANNPTSERTAKHWAVMWVAFLLGYTGFEGAIVVDILFCGGVPFWPVMLGISVFAGLVSPTERLCDKWQRRFLRSARIVGSNKRVRVEDIERDT